MGQKNTLLKQRAFSFQMTPEELRLVLAKKRRFADARNSDGDTLLAMCVNTANVPIAQVLLEAGSDVGYVDPKTGSSLVGLAASAKQHEMISLLLSFGARVDVADFRLVTPLHVASGLDDQRCFDLVLAKCTAETVNAKTNDGLTALQIAVRADNRAFVNALIEARAVIHLCDSGGVTALHDAIRMGNTELVDKLLRLGASPNVTDKQGCSVLHYAASASNSPLLLKLAMESSLLSCRNREGNSVLHLAIRHKCSLDAVAYVAKHAASDANLQNKAGQTPLDVAKQVEFREACELLAPLTHPIDPTTQKTLRIQFISDIHLEFGSNPKIVPKAPIIALLGDTGLLSNCGTIPPPVTVYEDFLVSLSEKFERVIVIAGNHEAYRMDHDAALEQLATICARHPRLTFLNRSSIVVEGVRLIGTTLWSHIPEQYAADIASAVADYKAITSDGKPITPEITNGWHMRDVSFISGEISAAKQARQQAIVMTHHSPLFDCGTGNPEGFILSRKFAFFSDQRKLFGPPVVAWLCGHSHWFTDFTMRGTRILNNPHGYPREEIDCQDSVIEVPVWTDCRFPSSSSSSSSSCSPSSSK